MRYYVYMLVSKSKNKFFSYIGYTKNIEKRMKLHNSSNGAKYTRGKKWIMCYKEIYLSKSKALSREYHLKKDRNFRNLIKEKFIRNKYLI